MIDESFHLTPLDVRRYEFATQMRGYEKARVDQFREQVADELERLTRVNQELDAKAKGLAEQLKAFRDRDKALNDALVSAQQLRAEIREQADRESQLILREARAEGDKLLDQARAEIRKLQVEVDNLERVRRTYLLSLRTIAEKQLAEVEALAGAPPVGGAAATGADAANGAKAPKSETPARGSGSWLDQMVRE
ncbi:MAG: DivIVA domain-containing protein [Gemmatimonadetes bacterium]|nr:DivIVA domain-containing protein [Gemmatimonadota bacterium]